MDRLFHAAFYVVGIVLLGVIALIGSKLRQACFSSLAKIPGPAIGRWTDVHLRYHALHGDRMQYIESLHRKYGSVVRVGPHEIAINTPEAVRTVQKVQGGFAKSEWYDKTGPGLIGMRDREKHSRRRRLLAHPLSNTALQEFEPLVRTKIDLAMRKIRDENRKLGHADVYKWFGLMATDIIGDLTFGSSFGMLEQGRGNQYTQDLQSALHQVHKRIELYPLLDILAYLPLPQAKEVGEKFKRIAGYGKESMLRLKHAQLTGALNTPIFFGKLISVKDSENSLTDQELEEEAAEFMITGTDTTSNTLTYLVWVVLKHREVRAKLEKEVADLPEDFKDADLSKLKYLPCVVQEALRLYGAASGSHARSVPRNGWEIEGYYLPPTTVVTSQAYSLHRRPETFEDPFSFKPERWLDPSPEMQLSYIPFGGGPRICIGIHLAYMELRLTTAAFFRAFKGAVVDPSLTEDDMHLENYTLISPKGKKCLVRLLPSH